MVARFTVAGSLDGGGRLKKGTVLIDRKAGTFSVRPHRSRTTYTVDLSAVADIVVERLIKAELRAKAKKSK